MTKATQRITNKHKDNLINHEERKSTRLNKFISDSGFCSRREADRLIDEGRVTIDDELATKGMQVFPNQIVKVNNTIIKPKSTRVYIALHKPTGITTTNDLEIKNNIRAFVNYKELIFPIGRLDKDSSGLILLTNDGDIVNKILREEHGHDKEYIVSVDREITNDFINKIKNGIEIYNPVSHKYQVTNKCEVIKINKNTFKIILNQGLNRQIRRMTKALKYNVKTLKRVRVMNIELNDLKVGEWRYLSTEELKVMNELINK